MEKRPQNFALCTFLFIEEIAALRLSRFASIPRAVAHIMATHPLNAPTQQPPFWLRCASAGG
jgi:hypothetical protein